jgi:hypothetical protein
MKNGMVAGTLVHTDKGLVPIEQLKVGDMVLSKHESNTGEQAYKSVVSTFKSATRQPIMAIPFMSKTLNELAENQIELLSSLTNHDSPDGIITFDQEKYDVCAKKITDFIEKKYQTSFEPHDVHGRGRESYDMYLFCTDSHPFWVEGQGWTIAEELCAYDTLQSYDGDVLSILDLFDAKEYGPLYITSVAGIAAYFLMNGEKDYYYGRRHFVDFRFGRPTFPMPCLTYGNIFNNTDNDTDREEYEHCLSAFQRWIHPLEPVYIRLSDPAYPAQISNIDHPLVDFSDCCTGKSIEFNDEFGYGIGANCCDLGDGTPRFKDYVYNIEVEGFHTYYVGYAGVLVKARNIKLRLVEPFTA